MIEAIAPRRPDGADDELIAAERAVGRGALDEARCLLEDRRDTPARVLLGVVALRVGDAHAAKLILTSAASSVPNDAVASAYSALALVLVGDVAEARTALDRALELAPNRFIVRVIDAQYWYRLGCYGEAMRLARGAMTVGAPDREHYAFAASLFRLAGERARGTFVRGAGGNGGNRSGWWRGGQAAGANGREGANTAWT